MAAGGRVLVLGAGRVSGPVYGDLATQDVHVTAVSMIKSELDHVREVCPKATLVTLNIGEDEQGLEALIQNHDVVVGLVPYSMLPGVARSCLKIKRNLVTASYVDDVIKGLHQQVQDAGLTFLCEVGLDPGIDHMLAMRTFDVVRDRGGEVTSYKLWCGGVPSLECADNPLKYKFSWYPRGSLYACVREGGYKKNGQIVTIPAGPQMMESSEDVTIGEDMAMEGFPNVHKDSYLELYGVQSADTFVRGTLRHKGFCSAISGLIKLGLFDDKSHSLLSAASTSITWKKYICHTLEVPEQTSDDVLESKVKAIIGEDRFRVIKRLGLMESDTIEGKDTPLDTLSWHLEKRTDFAYGPGERDQVIMHIGVEAKFPAGSRESHCVDMVVHGESGGHSAMAKTVGHTVASATMLLINGSIKERGVVLPTLRTIYTPLLSAIAKKGIVINQKITVKT